METDDKIPDRMPPDIGAIEPPDHLRDAIFARLDLEKRRMRLLRKTMACGVLAVSFAALVAAGYCLAADLHQSGLGQYLSLLFSDSRYVLDCWGAYALTLVESMPFASIGGSLMSLFFFMAALQFAARNLGGACKRVRPA